MPEVAEIALTSEILLKYFKNKILESLHFVEGRFSKNSPPGFDDFNKALPLKVKNISSKGKFLWWDLVEIDNENNHWYIWNTFGLSGMWSLFEPKYNKAELTFNNNKVAYFSDLRNFGTFKFSNSYDLLEKKLKSLAPDFLKEDFDIYKINKYNIPIVKILMDQKKVGSGLGNYLVAEILYRAKISPHRNGKEINDDELENLEYWIKYMVKLAYTDNHIGYMVNLENESEFIKRKNYHDDIILKKKEFEFQVYRKKFDPKGNPVKADNIIKGRTTYWVPDVQK